MSAPQPDIDARGLIEMMDHDELVALSVRLEEETGYDSIPTIERVYDCLNPGTYRCPWPKCGFARKDAVAMWRHVHFGRKHPLSFNVRTPEEV